MHPGALLILVVVCLNHDVDAVVDYRHRTAAPRTTPALPTTPRVTPTSRPFWQHSGEIRWGSDGFELHTGQDGHGLQFNWNWQPDFSGLTAGDRWWEGPNVCRRTLETQETAEDGESTEAGIDYSQIIHHRLTMSSTCDDTDTAYKCVTLRSYNGNTTRRVQIYECCHGYRRRNSNDIGCNEQMELQDTLSTLQSLGLTEMINGIDSSSLRQKLADSNFTIFSPTNDAFLEYEPPLDATGHNVVVVSPELMSLANRMVEVVSSHITVGFVRGSDFEDDLVLNTEQSAATIRINTFSIPRTIVTANCVPIVSADNMATNGIIHTTADVMDPVDTSLADVIREMPQLSTFYELASRVGLLELLQKSGSLTVFAPTNAAFDKLGFNVTQMIDDRNCLLYLVQQHILPHVVCTAAIEGEARTVNLLGRRVNLTSQISNEQPVLRFNSAQLVTTDVMGTNGVLHVINEVIVPNEALLVHRVAEKLGANQFLRWIQKSDLAADFQGLQNVTVFLPSDEAIKNLPAKVIERLTKDRQELSRLVRFHIVPEMLDNIRLATDHQLTTLDRSRKVIFSADSNYPFGHQIRTTVQCLPVVSSCEAACNGAIRPISGVLLPPKGNVLDTLYHRSEFSQLVAFLKHIGYADQLQTSNLMTFFAPTNQAFSSLPQELLNEMRENPEKAQMVIKYHMIHGSMCCASMADHWAFGRYKRTLEGRPVTLRHQRGQSTINGVDVQSCDLVATNGIVHSVDQFLPAALRHHLTRGPGRRSRGHNLRRWMTSIRDSFEPVWDDFWNWD